ncbi:MAG TPA: ATP-binding protein, partial [Burkholderiaceae bacterium]
MFQDRAGAVWAGTSMGLVRLRPDAAGKYTIDFFAVPSEIDGILQAPDGRLWVSTEAGMTVFDPATGKQRHYTTSDGLVDGTYHTNAVYQDPDGTMYFGGFSGGLTVFRPEKIRDNPFPPRVALTDFQVGNRPVRAGNAPAGVTLAGALENVREIALTHEHATLALEFAALHYSDPARNTYAYRLAGFDKQWITAAANKPFATYSNLAPGDYVFHVKAANKDGVWGPETTVKLNIAPPYWATWWFRVLAALLLLALLRAIYVLRVRRLVQKQHALEQKVRERTAELEAALGKLTTTQEQLIFREKMASVGTLTAGVAHEINNPANFAHAGAQILADELERFRLFLRELAGEGSNEDRTVMQAIEQRIDEMREKTGTVLEGTTRIRDLVRDLRTFARLDEAEKKTVDLVQSLNSTIHLVRSRYAQTVEIRTDFAFQPLLECWPAQLNQVFMNIIVNACHAIEDKLARTASAGPGLLQIRSRQDGGQFVLEFEDNGCGMPQAVMDRAFEPFYTTKDVGSGSGLGLSISFGIVAKHQGTLSVRSSEGEGSCFTVRLPLATTE